MSRALVLVVVACVISGCRSFGLTPYKEPASGPTARISFPGNQKFVYMDDAQTCAESTRGRIPKDSWAGVLVAAGRRVKVEQGENTSSPAASVSCFFNYSFVPEDGATYVSEYEAGRGGCRLNLYRVTASGERQVEPSARRDQPCP